MYLGITSIIIFIIIIIIILYLFETKTIIVTICLIKIIFTKCKVIIMQCGITKWEKNVYWSSAALVGYYVDSTRPSTGGK